MKARNVFISYKSEDYEMAAWVRSTLETNGITCWMAPSDIPGGSDYASEIPNAIANCRVFVVIISQKAQTSTWVPKELSLAVSQKKIIMPFMLENCKLRDDFNFYMTNVQRYEAYEDKVKAIQTMVREIQAILGVEKEISIQATPKAEERKKWPVAAAVCSVLILCGILVWFLFIRSQPEQPGGAAAVTGNETIADSEPVSRDETAESSTDENKNIPEAAGDNGSMEDLKGTFHITLSVSDDYRLKNYAADKQILKERIAVFSDGRPYKIIEQEDKLDLFLPEESFASETIETTLKCYISRAIRLYLVDQEGNSKPIPVQRDDLESVELHVGTIPDVDASEFNITDPTYQYITIALKDEFVEKHKPEYESWKKIVFAQDAEEMPNSYVRYFTFPVGDGKNYYVLNNDLGGKYSELVVYNLTHDSLSESFRYLIDVNTRVQWETGGDAMTAGKNQCDYDSFTDGTITFSLISREGTTQGEFVDTEEAIKARLDALGNPYAIGTSKQGDAYILAVKTTLSHINDDVIELLRKFQYGSLKDSCFEVVVQPLKEIRINGGDTNKFSLVLGKSNSYFQEKLEAFNKQRGEDAGDIYFCLGDFPVFRSKELNAEKLTLESGEFCKIVNGQTEGMQFESGSNWYTEFISTILKTNDLMKVNLVLTNWQFNPDSHGNLPTNKDFAPAFYSDAENLQKAIQEVSPDASASYYSGNLYVYLNLSLDDSFPEKAADLPQKIYEAINPKNLYLDHMVIYLIDADTNPGESAWVRFQKELASISAGKDSTLPETTDGYYYMFVLEGEKTDQYKEAIQKNTEASPFYQEHFSSIFSAGY